ncbi:MAG: cytochrome B6 [Desulfuromonas sp.]|nr:MAG: cytochrome B6 [Desulfuromonas sp.]
MDDRTVLPSQRRRFLLVMLTGVGGVLAAAAGWPIFRFLSPENQSGSGGKIKIARETVAVGTAHFFDYRGKPAVLLQPEPGRFVAMSAVCTHLGCIVKWIAEDNHFLCPCHGGKFSPAGDVVAGPPPSALENFPVALEGDQVLVG